MAKKTTNLNFKNINKIFPKSIIKKMRQEDLRIFYLNKKKFMLSKEKRRFENKIFGQGEGFVSCWIILLVERKGKKLKFINFD